MIDYLGLDIMLVQTRNYAYELIKSVLFLRSEMLFLVYYFVLLHVKLVRGRIQKFSSGFGEGSKPN